MIISIILVGTRDEEPGSKVLDHQPVDTLFLVTNIASMPLAFVYTIDLVKKKYVALLSIQNRSGEPKRFYGGLRRIFITYSVSKI